MNHTSLDRVIKLKIIGDPTFDDFIETFSHYFKSQTVGTPVDKCILVERRCTGDEFERTIGNAGEISCLIAVPGDRING